MPMRRHARAGSGRGSTDLDVAQLSEVKVALLLKALHLNTTID